MSEIIEKQILLRLEKVEEKMDTILEYIEDSKLSEDDREAVREALHEEKEGKLLTKKQVFG